MGAASPRRRDRPAGLGGQRRNHTREYPAVDRQERRTSRRGPSSPRGAKNAVCASSVPPVAAAAPRTAARRGPAPSSPRAGAAAAPGSTASTRQKSSASPTRSVVRVAAAAAHAHAADQPVDGARAAATPSSGAATRAAAEVENAANTRSGDGVHQRLAALDDHALLRGRAPAAARRRRWSTQRVAPGASPPPRRPGCASASAHGRRRSPPGGSPGTGRAPCRRAPSTSLRRPSISGRAIGRRDGRDQVHPVRRQRGVSTGTGMQPPPQAARRGVAGIISP